MRNFQTVSETIRMFKNDLSKSPEVELNEYKTLKFRSLPFPLIIANCSVNSNQPGTQLNKGYSTLGFKPVITRGTRGKVN